MIDVVWLVRHRLEGSTKPAGVNNSQISQDGLTHKRLKQLPKCG
jgi:hypothetical protein